MKEKIEKLIIDLLDDSLAPGEKLEPGVRHDSSKTVAAKARNKMSELVKGDIPFIKEIISNDKNKDRRNKAYSLLLSIAKKYNDPELIHFLIEQINTEKNKSFIGLNLTSISSSKLTLNKHSEIILDFAKNKNTYIRHSAIQVLALYNSDLEQIEEFLIEILNSSKNQYDIYYSNITLQNIGSKKSIESLKKIIGENKNVDVLITGIYALGRIDGSNQVDFFLEMMKEKKDSFVKSTLTEFISKHADNRAVDILVDRVKKILSRKRNRNMHYAVDQYPEIIHALMHLTKFEEEDSRIPKLKKWILEKKMDFLDETETNWIKKNIKAGNIS